MKIADSVLDLIGRTPLVRFHDDAATDADILVKLERCNPLGSIKERPALAMIEDAEARGLVGKGSVVIEPTSGNTGIALAMVCAVRGYRLILTMPDSMSVERQRMLEALGADLVLTPGDEGMRGAIERADDLANAIDGAFVPNQFTHPANPKAHEVMTAREIWEDTDGRVDAVVVGIGSGGTATGLARFFARTNPRVEIVGVEPAESPFLTAGQAGAHSIQGIGAGFRPPILEEERLTRVVTIAGVEAIEWTRRLAKHQGIFCGISSGAAVAAAVRLANEPCEARRTIVAILPDGGEKYLSSAVWGDDDAR